MIKFHHYKILLILFQKVMKNGQVELISNLKLLIKD